MFVPQSKKVMMVVIKTDVKTHSASIIDTIKTCFPKMPIEVDRDDEGLETYGVRVAGCTIDQATVLYRAVQSRIERPE